MIFWHFQCCLQENEIKCNKFIYFCVFLGSSSWNFHLFMQKSWGAENLDNAKQFDTLFSLYSTPRKTQASSCQLLGVKPDATALFHMETEIAPSGGGRECSALWPRAATSKSEIKYCSGATGICYPWPSLDQTLRNSREGLPWATKFPNFQTKR